MKKVVELAKWFSTKLHAESAFFAELKVKYLRLLAAAAVDGAGAGAPRMQRVRSHQQLRHHRSTSEPLDMSEPRRNAEPGDFS